MIRTWWQNRTHVTCGRCKRGEFTFPRAFFSSPPNLRANRFPKVKLTGYVLAITCNSCSMEFELGTFMGLDSRGYADPFAYSLLVGGKYPRRMEKYRRELQENPPHKGVHGRRKRV